MKYLVILHQIVGNSIVGSQVEEVKGGLSDITACVQKLNKTPMHGKLIIHAITVIEQ